MVEQNIFVCSKCDSQFPKWTGRCSSCGSWNTLSEQRVARSAGRGATAAKASLLGSVSDSALERVSSGVSEFDHILGGYGSKSGFVPGSLVLLGGDPGIGKSTLALQTALKTACKQVLYITGEESLPQVKSRALRISGKLAELSAASETDLDSVCALLEQTKPDFAVIDSIQTMYSQNTTGVAGGPAQVSYATNRLMELGKRLSITLMILGHVTKEGNLAGPRMLEHMVDVVLYLEGDRFGTLRLLRCVKNRYGSTNEVGVFEMKENGLQVVSNPSDMFLAERVARKPGNAVTATVDGSQCLLLEVQALVGRTEYNYPKRNATGYDYNRLQLMAAVIQRSLKINLSERDIYVSVAGGYRISETACDLAVALAIVSSYKDISLPDDVVLIGELGLSGEIRKAPALEKRLRESSKLGFKKALVPGHQEIKKSPLTLVPVGDLAEAVKKLKM